SLSSQAAAQRNIGNFQITSDLELLVDMPDKYVRSESSNSPMVNMASTLGFNGDRAIKASGAMATPGGGMMIRMGGPGPGMPPPGATEKPTPEQQAQLDKQIVRSARQEIGRLMLGWFAMAHPSLNVQYTYAGEAESPDGKAFIVDAKKSDGFTPRLLIDEKTSLPVMVTYQGPQPRTVTVGSPGPRAGSERSQAQTQPRQVSPDEQKKLAADAQSQLYLMQKQPPAVVEYALFFDDWRDEGGIKFPHV